MAKKAYIGVDNIARKIKKGYIGVDNIARKIKKAYIGIGGVARPCWSGGELAFYGEITPLSVSRGSLAAASVGNYALFAGGMDSDKTLFATVDAYNNSLTHSTPTALSVARQRLAGASVGNYALFASGTTGTIYDTGNTTVDAYNNSLTRSTPTVLGTNRGQVTAASVGNYALFAGGYLYKSGYGQSSEYFSVVDAYNASLTRSTPTELSEQKDGIAAASVGNYALFAGGSGSKKSVDAYDTSLTRSTPTPLDNGYSVPKMTTTENYAVCYVGNDYPIEVYNKSLTKITMEHVFGSQYGSPLSEVSFAGYGIFGSLLYQFSPTYIYKNFIIAYDDSLTIVWEYDSQLATTGKFAVVGNYAINAVSGSAFALTIA